MKLSSLSFDQLNQLRDAFESEVPLPVSVFRQGLHYSNATVNIQFSWFSIGYSRAVNDLWSTNMSVKNSSNLTYQEALTRAIKRESEKKLRQVFDENALDARIKGMYFATAADAMVQAGQPGDEIPEMFARTVLCFLDVEGQPYVGVYTMPEGQVVSMGEAQDAAEMDAKRRLAAAITAA